MAFNDLNYSGFNQPEKLCIELQDDNFGGRGERINVL